MRAPILILLATALLGGCQTGGTGATAGSFEAAPLPADVMVEQPAADIAPEFAAYSGTWHGKWGGELDTFLVVEAIDPPLADVVYSWGTSSSVDDPGWTRRTGRFEQGGLSVLLNPGISTRFEMREDGTIGAEYANDPRGWHSTAILRRVE